MADLAACAALGRPQAASRQAMGWSDGGRSHAFRPGVRQRAEGAGLGGRRDRGPARTAHPRRLADGRRPSAARAQPGRILLRLARHGARGPALAFRTRAGGAPGGQRHLRDLRTRRRRGRCLRDHLAAGAGRGPRRHRAADGPARGAQRHRPRHGGAGTRARRDGGGGRPRALLAGRRDVPPAAGGGDPQPARRRHLSSHQPCPRPPAVGFAQEQDPDPEPDRRLQRRTPRPS